MSSSDSDEDVHQCGRCKEVFISLENYFAHKKSKTCQKSKAPRLSKPVILDNEADLSVNNQNEADPSVNNQNEADVPPFDCADSNLQDDTITEMEPDCDIQENTDAEIIMTTEQTNNIKQPENNILTSAQCDNDTLPSYQHDNEILTSEEHNDNGSSDQDHNKNVTRSQLRSLPRKSKIIADYAKLTRRETNSDSVPNSDQSSDKHVPLRKRKLKVDFDTSSEQENIVETNPVEVAKKCLKPTNYACSECEFTALYKDEYTAHLYNAHKISDKKCNFCHKPFRYKHRLKQHIISQKCQKGKQLKNTATKSQPETQTEKEIDEVHVHVNEQSDDKQAHENDHTMNNIENTPPKTNKVEIKLHRSNKSKSQMISHEDDSDMEDTDNDEEDTDIHKSRMSTRKSVKKKTTKKSKVIKDKTVDKRKKNQTVSFACPNCLECFDNYIDVKTHMEKHHPATYCGICKLCGKYYPTKYKLWRHMTSNLHKGLVSENDIIAAKAELVSEPIARRGRPSKSNDMNCKACKTSFKTKHDFHEHVQRHHSNRLNTKCVFCFQIFPTDTVHQTHMISVHQIDKDDFNVLRCSVCCRMFSHKHHVVRHKLKVHKPQVPHSSDPKSYDPSAEIQMEAVIQNEAMNHNESTLLNAVKTNDKSKQQVKDLSSVMAHKCFLCCEYFPNIEKLNIHLEYHKVWVPTDDNLVIDTVYQSVHNSKENSTEDDGGNGDNNVEASDSSTEIHKEMDVSVDKDNKTGDDDVIAKLGLKAKAGDPFKTAKSVDDGLNNTNNKSTELDAQGTTEKSSNAKSNDQFVKDITEYINNDKTFVCPYCARRFTDWENFKQHKIVNHKLKPVFKCIKEECFQIFETLDEYKDHSTEHPQRAFICISCNDHFSSLEFLMMHRLSFHIQRTDGFKCYGCGDIFETSEERKIHQTNVKHEFQCKKCDRAFKTEMNLKSHELSHSNMKHFLCDECGAGFTNKHALKRHTFTHYPIEDFPCPTCGKLFKKRDHMKRHLMTTHVNVKPFKCTITGCTRAYKRKDKLKEHMKTHSNEPLFICQFCSRSFKYKQALQYHEKTHSKDRRRECTQCDALFYTLSDLKEHFVRDHNIKMKSQHHTNVCPKCKLSFTRVERLNRHIEKVHKDHKAVVIWTTKCHICRKGFAGEKSLSTHLEKRHNMLKSTDETTRMTDDMKSNVYVVNRLNTSDIIIKQNEQTTENPVTLNVQQMHKATDPQQFKEQAKETYNAGTIPPLLVLQYEPNSNQDDYVNNNDTGPQIKHQYLENIQSYQREEHISRESDMSREPIIQKESHYPREAIGNDPKVIYTSTEPTYTREPNALPTLRRQLDLHDPNYFVGIAKNHELERKEEANLRHEVNQKMESSTHFQSINVEHNDPMNVLQTHPLSVRTVTYPHEPTTVQVPTTTLPYSTVPKHNTTTTGLYTTNTGLYTTNTGLYTNTQGLYSTSPVNHTTNARFYATNQRLYSTSSELYTTSPGLYTVPHSMIKTQQKSNENAFVPILPFGSPVSAAHSVSAPQLTPHSRLSHEAIYDYPGNRIIIPEGESQGSAILKSVAMQPVNHHSNPVLLPKPPYLPQLDIAEHHKNEVNNDGSSSEPSSSELSSSNDLRSSSAYIQNYYMNNQN
ncbi:unnamed protein product [Owenia fusiformis]|uniref:Uncharacterized protein n=1 Tax=Owenia fusiformis TaxID=6347 RepID=A0A8J1URL0_OWEFU|nr:unnamed protein product [Owenia fusiformis]